MMDENKRKPKQHNTFAFASLDTWLHLLKENGGVDKKYRAKMAGLLLLSFFTIPFKIYERRRYGRAISATSIHPSPIFIIGHHRSGTTYLHNLISQDPELGFISTFQATVAGFSIIGQGWFKAKLAEGFSPKRAMDNVDASLDAPQEEEIAVANLCPYSFMHHMSFPRKTMEYLDKYLLLETLSDAELNRRKEIYLCVLKKTTYLAGGKRLVLKGPVNTGQIKFLLSLFPDAKFIHIHRNPYTLFPSIFNLGRRLQDAHLLQEFDDASGVDNIFLIYKKMMKKFLAEKHLIPAGNFIEVSYDELDQHPLETLTRIYEQLNLPGFESKKAIFENYIQFLGHYEKNKLTLEPEYRKRINEEWGFAFDEWKYPREVG